FSTQKTAYEIETRLEFRRVLFRSPPLSWTEATAAGRWLRSRTMVVGMTEVGTLQSRSETKRRVVDRGIGYRVVEFEVLDDGLVEIGRASWRERGRRSGWGRQVRQE